ncbi:MAG: transposase, partial [Planctomycetota bacterium]
MPNRRRILDDQLWAHFVTFTCYRRRKTLDQDHPKKIILGILAQQLRIQNASCIGYVIMQDHVHALIWFPKPGQLSEFMHGWKRKSSFGIRNWYREHSEQYFREFGEGDKFWQPKYYSFEIENRHKIEEKLTYIHLNPVRRGLVERAVDWKWSSARWYENKQSVGVPIDW